MELFDKIQSILFKDWDPVGIGENPNLKDEYDSYIGIIVKALVQNAPIESIVKILERIEKEELCIENTNSKHLQTVAQKLSDIYGLHAKS